MIVVSHTMKRENEQKQQHAHKTNDENAPPQKKWKTLSFFFKQTTSPDGFSSEKQLVSKATDTNECARRLIKEKAHTQKSPFCCL